MSQKLSLSVEDFRHVADFKTAVDLQIKAWGESNIMPVPEMQAEYERFSKLILENRELGEFWYKFAISNVVLAMAGCPLQGEGRMTSTQAKELFALTDIIWD